MTLRRAWQYLVLLVACIATSAFAQQLVFEWAAKPTGPLGTATGNCNSFSTQHVAALDPAGNVIRVGYVVVQDGAPSQSALYAAKYASANGAELWRFTLPASDRDFATTCLFAVAVDGGGNAFVTGRLEDGNGRHDYVAKLSGADGSVLWQAFSPTENGATNDAYGADIALDAAGNPVVLGTQTDTGTGSFATIVKYDGSTGAVLWHRMLDAGTEAGTSQTGVAVAVDPSGDVIAALYDLPGSQVFKLAGNTGTTVWHTPWTWTIPASGPPELRGLIVDPLGKIVIFGKGIAKFAADGTLDWQTTLKPADSSSDTWGATFASNGDVVATGSTLNATQMTVARFLSATGAVVWSQDAQAFDTSFGGQGGRSVAMDANGDVIAVGALVQDPNIPYSEYTEKLNGSTGALKDYAYYQEGHAPNLVLVRPGSIFVNGPPFLLKYADQSTATVAPPPPKLAGTMPRKMDFNADHDADIAWRDPSTGYYTFYTMNGLSRSVWAGMVAPDMRTFFDVNGDGRSDPIFRFPDGSYGYWRMNQFMGENVNNNWLPAGTGWDLVGTGHFDGDAISDALWRNASGVYGMWLLKDPNVECCEGQAKAAGAIMMPGPGFEVVQIADFNGDGMDDLLWRHPDGRVVIALMNGMTTTASAQVLGGGTGWTPVLVGDFNGDGKADILWRHDNGSYGIWLVNGTSIQSYAAVLGANTGWTATMVGDLDGDGKHDILWAHTDGSQGAWLMNGTTIKAYGSFVGPGSAWEVVRTDDFDGDGSSDLLWRNKATNQYGIWLMNGLSYKAYGGLDEPLTWKAEP